MRHLHSRRALSGAFLLPSARAYRGAPRAPAVMQGATMAPCREAPCREAPCREAPTSCRICLTEFKTLPCTDDIVLLGCFHAYCEACIEEWWGQASSKSCPVCRQQFASLRTCQRLTADTINTAQPSAATAQPHWRWRMEDEQAAEQGTPRCGKRSLSSGGASEGPSKRPTLSKIDPAGAGGGASDGGTDTAGGEPNCTARDGAETWYSSYSAHPWIGRRCLRFFHGLPFIGKIFSYLPPTQDTDGNVADIALWKIRHADGLLLYPSHPFY